MRAGRLVVGLLFAWLVTGTALARVERFAVVVGNNRGLASEIALRYAEADARKVAEVLRELGAVEPANLVVLAGSDADTARRTLITVNDRIRAAVSEPDTSVVLFVYYSGHADDKALHLGPTRLETAELAELVRGSAATFRLLVVDACRSGKLTRPKGGKLRPPFALENEVQLPGEGLAFLTASSADEDAQESDELKGSFFTHALVSGLLGAADQDGDGAVVLDEAYRYAYDATLRATSRSAAGTQHPTFQYDLRGQGRLVLTETRLSHVARGTLSFAPGLDALVFRDSAEGAVVAEVLAHGSARSLSLVPGKYFVRVRGSAYLLEGSVTVLAKNTLQVDASQLERIAYARLVRKGGAGPSLAQGIELGGLVHGALPNASTPCWGGTLGYRVDLARASLLARAGYCQSSFSNETLAARVHEVDLSLRGGHAWDVSPLTFELGIGAAAVLFVQRFDTEGSAPTRTSAAGNASAYLALLYELPAGLYLALDGEAQLYVLRLQEGAHDSLRAAFSPRGTLSLGKHF
jgi:Caspase domain